MSFYISLSGLKASQVDLSTISNNVANVSSTAFKKSKAQFGDIFAAAPMQTTNQVAGQGVRVQGVAQQFTQGTLETTDKALDMAIAGEGYFTVKGEDGNISYTRNGAFSVDNDRFAVDTTGARIQVFAVNPTTGNLSNGSGAAGLDLSITGSGYFKVGLADGTTAYTRTGDFRVSSNGSIVNGDGLPLVPAITATPGATNISVSTDGTVREGTTAIGNIQIAAFVNPEGLQPVDTTGDDVAVGDLFVATTSSGAPITETAETPGIGGRGTIASGSVSTANLTAASLQDLQIPTANANGDQLTSVAVGKDGLVSAVYADGSTVYLGQVAMASFNSQEGLRQEGDAHWTSTVSSGAPIFGTANQGMFGSVNSGMLERSNVDITDELVALIAAQRNFQANSKAIEAANTLTTTIVNLRS